MIKNFLPFIFLTRAGKLIILAIIGMIFPIFNALAYPHHAQINRTPYATGQGTINFALEYQPSYQTAGYYLGQGITPWLDLGLKWEPKGKWGMVSKICLLTEERYYISFSTDIDTYEESLYFIGGKMLAGLTEVNLELVYDFSCGSRAVYLRTVFIPSILLDIALKLGYQEGTFSSSIVCNFYPHRRWLLGVEQNLQRPETVIRSSILIN